REVEMVKYFTDGPPSVCYIRLRRIPASSCTGCNMRRREFVGLIGGAAAWPLAARAQQSERVRRVGVLMAYAENDPEGKARFAGFRQGLTDFGWVEGRNLHIDVRWSGLEIARQQRDAYELITLMPDLILASNTTTTQVLRDATRTISIVFVALADPVA